MAIKNTFTYTPVLYNGQEIDEYDAQVMIHNGTPLSSFSRATKLMTFTAVTSRKEGWREIPANQFGKLLSKLAVKQDYRAISRIPEELTLFTVYEFVMAKQNLGREELPVWVKLFNMQSSEFITKCVKLLPSCMQYVDDEKKTHSLTMMANARIENSFKVNPQIEDPDEPKTIQNSDSYSLVFDDEEITPSTFFMLPAEERTPKALEKLVQSREFLPDNFIEQLILPGRNAIYLKRAGDMESAMASAKEMLPYVTKDLCMKIAYFHPEASIKTPSFLSEEGVRNFMTYLKNKNFAPDIRAYYFLKFPEKYLKLEDTEGLRPSKALLMHAPNILKNSEIANAYLGRYPYEVFTLPMQYQNVNTVLRVGANALNERNINKIQNEEFRKKLKLALNL